MPTLDLDFGDVGKMPPEGVWRILIKSAILKQNKAKDGQIIDFEAEFMDMPDPSYEGFKIFPNPNASLKPTARWKLQEVLGAITQEDWSDDNMKLEVNGPDDAEPYHIPLLEGKTSLIVFVHDTYNNKPSMKVDTWIPDNGEVTIGETVSPDGSVV